MRFLRPFLFVTLVGLAGCGDKPGNDSTGSTKDTTPGGDAAITEYSKSLPLSTIKLPEGFKIDVFAEVENARSLAISSEGTVFVGNRDKDKVYAVKDTDGDFKADKKWIVADSLNMPNGVAFKDGDLYVAEMTRILKFPGIESTLNNPGKPQVICEAFPEQDGHGWKYIAFGPDGKLYVPVGAPCNICEPKEDIYASITRMNADGSGREVFAKGVRNTVGFTWHPETSELWFTDNGRDMMGDEIPNCELNLASKQGMHFGYPYCHEGSVKDPDFGNKRPCSDFVAPVEKLGPHVAPLGLKFYTGSMFPESYKNKLIVARHGSWNRSKKIGQDLVMVNIKDNKSEGFEVFASGWLNDAEQKVWGRPVDVLTLKDGSMLVSDDYANVIYRISYEK
ncbi:MAG TPA: sorbosone dehydrogenase family protein [Chryseosolibacter sp.]